MNGALLSIAIRQDRDIVHARQQARFVAERLGFDGQDQTRIATAVSEVGRNAFAYGGGGRVEFRLAEHGGRPELVVEISDQGPGIPEIDRILDGQYTSPTGLGLGLRGAKRLVDRMEVETSSSGTRIRLCQRLPRPLGGSFAEVAARVADALARALPPDPIEEVKRQNRELLDSLAALRRREEDLTAALAEKEVLLREVYHRVKNNLQIISSLMSLKARRSSDVKVRRQLDEVRARIHALSLLHEKLYQSDDLSHVDVGAYIRELCAHLRQSFLGRDGEIRLEVDADPVRMTLDNAIQLGLLLNEIVTNAFKHAFPGGRSGRILVALHEVGNDRLALRIEDDGVGLPAEAAGGNGSLGMTLIHALAKRIDGRVDIASGAGGTTVVVDMPREG